MRRFAICCAVVLIGCDKPKDQPAADAAADTPAPAAPAAPAPISLAAVAGKWAVRTMNETGDSTLVSYEMVASADSSAWNFTFPGRKPIPMRIIAVAGDSIGRGVLRRHHRPLPASCARVSRSGSRRCSVCRTAS